MNTFDEKIIPRKYKKFFPVLQDIHNKNNDGLHTILNNGNTVINSSVHVNEERFLNTIRLQHDNEDYLIKIRYQIGDTSPDIEVFENKPIEEQFDFRSLFLDNEKEKEVLNKFCNIYNENLRSIGVREKIEPKGFFNKIRSAFTIEPKLNNSFELLYLDSHQKAFYLFNQIGNNSSLETENYEVNTKKELEKGGQVEKQYLNIHDKRENKTIFLSTELIVNRDTVIQNNFDANILIDGKAVKLSEKKLNKILLPATIEINNYLKNQKFTKAEEYKNG